MRILRIRIPSTGKNCVAELTFLAAELSGELCNVPELAVELLVHLVDLQHGARIPVKQRINSHRKSKQHFSRVADPHSFHPDPDPAF